MTPYEKVRPKYVREWLAIKKKNWMDLMEARLLNAKKSGLIPREQVVEVKMSTKDQLKALGININFGDYGLDGMSDGGHSAGNDVDVQYLESDDEELKDQD